MKIPLVLAFLISALTASPLGARENDTTSYDKGPISITPIRLETIYKDVKIHWTTPQIVAPSSARAQSIKLFRSLSAGFKTFTDKSGRAEYVVTYDVTTNEESEALSIFIDEYRYDGGAHGSNFISVMTFNTKTGSYVSSPVSLFNKGAQEYFFTKIDAQIKESLHSNATVYSPTAKINPAKAVYRFVPSGLNIVFPQGELGPYASGKATFFFSNSELAPFRTPRS